MHLAGKIKLKVRFIFNNDRLLRPGDSHDRVLIKRNPSRPNWWNTMFGVFVPFVILTLQRLNASTMVIHSSLSDFVLFLYIHFAQIDDSYDPKELDVIKAKMKRLYPEGTDLEKKLYQGLRQYQTVDKGAINDLFADTLAFFLRQDQEVASKAILSDLQEIIKADGTVMANERHALAQLTSLLERQPT